MTLTKPGWFRIWDVRAYRKTESQGASQRDLWLCRWKGTLHTGVHCGEDIGALCSSRSSGTKRALHTMQGDDICPWVHTHSSGPQPAATIAAGWQNGRVLALKKKVLLIRFYKASGAGPWGGRGEVVHATGLMESNYLALGRVPGFRSFPPLRYSTAFPWPRRWPSSGQNSE